MDVLVASLTSWVCAWLYFRWRHRMEEQRLRSICQQVADRAYELLSDYDKPGFLVFCSDSLLAREAVEYGPNSSIHKAAHQVLNSRGLTVPKEM